MKTKFLLTLICSFILPSFIYAQNVYYASSEGAYNPGISAFATENNTGENTIGLVSGLSRVSGGSIWATTATTVTTWQTTGNTGITYSYKGARATGNYLGTPTGTDVGIMFSVNGFVSGRIEDNDSVNNGWENTSFGFRSLCNVTPSPHSPTGYGIDNVAVGYQSMPFATKGSADVGIGAESLGQLTIGNADNAIGYSALTNITSQSDCEAIGSGALHNLGLGGVSGGDESVAIGSSALHDCVTGTQNIAIGHMSLKSNTGSYNTVVGWEAGYHNTASYNDAFGHAALTANTTGTPNDAFGYQALTANQVGSYDDAFGYNALGSNVSGNDNTVMGYQAGFNTDVSDNTFIGYKAGMTNKSNNGGGNKNTCIGSGTDVGSTGLTNATAIGYGTLVTASNCLVLGNGAYVGIAISNPSHVLQLGIDDAYKATSMWSVPSDSRLKTNVHGFTDGWNVLQNINPIWFTYNGEAGTVAGETTMGAMAQELQKTAPYMVKTWNYSDAAQNSTQYLSVNYHALLFILTNTVKEQHQKVDSLQNNIALQQQQITTQQSEIDQLNTLVSKLGMALSQCCTNYQSTSGSTQTGATNQSPYLNQNVPNPFSQNTTISCYVPSSAQNASIVIYDLNGQLLKSYTVPATGFNQVVVSGGTLAAGDYLYTLLVDGQKIDTRKMTLTH